MSALDTTELLQANLGSSVPQSDIGFEIVARGCRLLLFRDLNDEIRAQTKRWEHADLALQRLGLDSDIGQIDPPTVEPRNLMEGPHSSLMEAPPEKFPSVNVAAFETRTSATVAQGTLAVADITVMIEAFVLEGPVPKGMDADFETVLHRKIQRLTEAIVLVIARDETMLGTTLPIQNRPLGGIANSSFADPKGNERYLRQGSRLEYTIQRQAAF